MYFLPIRLFKFPSQLLLGVISAFLTVFDKVLYIDIVIFKFSFYYIIY